MKSTNFIVRIVIVTCFNVSGVLWGQGHFSNLDFESANLPALPLGQYGDLGGVSSLDAIPGWTVYIGSSQSTQVLHNSVTTGSASVSILGPLWDNALGATIIRGNYSAVLQAGQFNGAHVSASIAQEGIVPGDAESIRMKISPFFSGGDLGVSLGTQFIPMVVLSEDSSGILMGGDISRYAGMQEQLQIASVSSPNNIFGSLVLDDIVFSSQPIPEPSTTVLVLAGAVTLFAIRAFRQVEVTNPHKAPERILPGG